MRGEDYIEDAARRVEAQGFQLQSAGQPANPAWGGMGMLQQQQQQQQQQPAVDDDVEMDVYQPPAIDEVIRLTATGGNPMFRSGIDVVIGQLEEQVEKEEAEAQRKKSQGGEK